MTRLVQLGNGGSRAVALVQEPRLFLLDGVSSVVELAQQAADSQTPLIALIGTRSTDTFLDYDSVYCGGDAWRLLPPIDHPIEPARCLVSGTGLTHFGSARNRQVMHGISAAEVNDSMTMFTWGVEGGKPAPGAIGAAPEWFYKGCGTIVRAHGEPLEVPAFGDDGGEEGEIAGIYLIDAGGRPCRIGMAIGNEFADHEFEKKNYLNLAGSKLRTCGLGPELVVDPSFDSVAGNVTIERAGTTVWSTNVLTGEREMCHSLSNIEHHHFKFDTHRRPGDVHIHFFGACTLSFGDGVQIADGDVMTIEFAGFGRALRNPLRVADGPDTLVTIRSLA